MPTDNQLRQAALITGLVAGNQTNVDRMLAAGREDNQAHLRFLAMYVICREIGLSTTVIGLLFKRDHSTVVHALKQVELVPHLHKRAVIIQQQYEALYERV